VGPSQTLNTCKGGLTQLDHAIYDLCALQGLCAVMRQVHLALSKLLNSWSVLCLASRADGLLALQGVVSRAGICSDRDWGLVLGTTTEVVRTQS
jgi:hypothetical protein